MLLLAAIEAFGASQPSEHSTKCLQLGMVSMLLWLAKWDNVTRLIAGAWTILLHGIIDHKDHRSCWNILQVFRSIDSQCVVGFPKDNNEAYDRGLVTGAPPLLLGRSRAGL
jgi:hypothetical protein